MLNSSGCSPRSRSPNWWLVRRRGRLAFGPVRKPCERRSRVTRRRVGVSQNPETIPGAFGAVMDHFDRTVDRLEDSNKDRHKENLERFEDLGDRVSQLTSRVGIQNGRVDKIETTVATNVLRMDRFESAISRLVEWQHDENLKAQIADHLKEAEVSRARLWQARLKAVYDAVKQTPALWAVVAVIAGLGVFDRCG